MTEPNAWHNTHDDDLDAGPRAGRVPDGTVLRRHRRGEAGRTEMIRFVARPGRRRPCPTSSAGCPAAASGSRRPGRRLRPRSRARLSRAASSATCASPPISSTMTERLLERAALDALAIAHKAGNGRDRLCQGRDARSRATASSPSCMRAEAAPDGGESSRPRCTAAVRGRQRIAVDRRLYLGAIGFGIGAVKCDTCSPACRSRKRDVSGARRAPRPFPGRPDAGCPAPAIKSANRRAPTCDTRTDVTGETLGDRDWNG